MQIWHNKKISMHRSECWVSGHTYLDILARGAGPSCAEPVPVRAPRAPWRQCEAQRAARPARTRRGGGRGRGGG